MLWVYRKLKPYLSGNARYFWGGIAALVVVDVFQLLIPRLVKRGIDALSFGRATPALLLEISAAIAALSLAIVALRFVWRYCMIGISRRMERNLRRSFYTHLLGLSPAWFVEHKVGDLMALATNDLEAVRMMAGIGVVALIDAAFLIVASVGMMFAINPSLTLFVLLPLPVLSIIVAHFGRILSRRFEKVQEAFAAMTDYVREVISGIRVIKSYVREGATTKRFSSISSDYVNKNIRMILIGGLFEPFVGLVVGIAFAIILLVGGRKVILMRMSMGDFVAFNSYLGLIIWPMIAAGWIINLYQRGKASLARIMRVFDEKPEITDAPDAVRLERVRGKIEFRNLTFRYKPNLPPALRDVSFRVEAGEFVGITGKTGSGKTTLLLLLMRLFDPPEGTVFVDGYDVKRIKLSCLRSAIGYVPQDSFLFSATVMENIKFGRPDASDEEAIMASKLAQFHKDVSGFPKGYDTVVGERGVMLSGGQKQRLAIARALLLDPPILILDDALSAVDTETEEAILSNLLETRRGKTTIIVSHRVSALQETDRIIVLDGGTVIEMGTHEKLLEQKGFYHELYVMQQIQSELEEVG